MSLYLREVLSYEDLDVCSFAPAVVLHKFYELLDVAHSLLSHYVAGCLSLAVCCVFDLKHGIAAGLVGVLEDDLVASVIIHRGLARRSGDQSLCLQLDELGVA